MVTRGRRSKTEEGRETGLKAASLETRGGPRVELTGHPVPPWPVSPTRALPGAACGTASRLARAPAAASGGTAQGEVSGHLVSEPVRGGAAWSVAQVLHLRTARLGAVAMASDKTGLPIRPAA